MQATLHPSKGGKLFEKLEFLGDRVLGLCISLLLFEHSNNEKEMAKKSAYLCSAQVLQEIAYKWNLAISCCHSQKQKILADVCEAVIGAIFIDSDYDIDVTKQFVQEYWAQYIADDHVFDVKTLLQELAHRRFQSQPTYNTWQSEGMPHAPTFISDVTLAHITTRGTGSSKKQAEKLAAQNALELLTSETV